MTDYLYDEYDVVGIDEVTLPIGESVESYYNSQGLEVVEVITTTEHVDGRSITYVVRLCSLHKEDWDFVEDNCHTVFDEFENFDDIPF